MEIPAITIAIIIAATVAIVNRVKAEIEKADRVIPTYWFTVMAFGIGAGVYAIATYAPAWAQTIFIIGLAASGIFDIFKKT